MLPNKTPYHIEDASTIDSPALLVFPAVVGNNIDNALKMVVDLPTTSLRPHVKTVKCQEVIRLAMEKGIDHFKCSTISEAELLGMTGAKDVLLCYQLSETKAKRFAALREKFPKTLFSALVDNKASATMLSNLFQKQPLTIFIDVNVGMNRTGIKTEDALEFIHSIKDFEGLNLKGLHAYDGHVHAPEVAIRKQQTATIYSEIGTLRKKAEGLLEKKLILVIGGSPSFPFYAKKKAVECSPGTIFFWDTGYSSSFPELPFIPAATILTRIISIIDTRTMCFDLGTKATASDPPQPRVTILGLENSAIVDRM